MAIRNIKLSQKAKDQLIKLKRVTGIEHWNTLCRWAFCLSLAQNHRPPDARIPANSSVEMTWEVFGGEYHAVYWALLKERCMQDGLDTNEDTLAKQFRLHLHRGISYLAGDKELSEIWDLLRKTLPSIVTGARPNDS
jgi:DNA sulfur modification protein DndE